MSFLGFMKDAAKAFQGKFWGTKIPDSNGTLRDTGVQEFVEELVSRLFAQQPIILDKPLELRNKTNGPAIIIYNDGPLQDWVAIRAKDRDGNEADFGIGLGSKGIVANEFIPHPDYAIDPVDQQKFYSDLGGNAGTDREHPMAVEAGNGLRWPLGMEGLFQVPIINWFKQPKYIDDDCHPVYRVEWFSQPVYWPTYIPQSQLFLATTDAQILQNNTGTATRDSDASTVTVTNPFFICVNSGETVLVGCIDGDYIIIQIPDAAIFATGTTVEAIAKGGSGDVTLDGIGIVEASSPFDSLTCDVAIAAIRNSRCDSWTVIAAECWDVDQC